MESSQIICRVLLARTWKEMRGREKDFLNMTIGFRAKDEQKQHPSSP